MFFIHDASVADSLQYHHTSAEVATSTTGVTDVDGSSIYRIASFTKLFTAFAGMLELDERDWDRPITDFVPRFAEYARDTPGAADPVNIVQWEVVTLAALSSHLAGVPRDVIPYNPSEFSYTIPNPVELYGLPPLDTTDSMVLPPCATSITFNCTADEYAVGAQARPPSFIPWTSPQYTDFGFMPLGLGISNITNKSIHDVYRDSIFGPLNMTDTSSQPPSDNSTWKNHVILGDTNNGGLKPEQAPEVAIPSGGIFSTTNDLAKWGTAMLKFTLVSPELGRAWEMYRYQHPDSGIITDLYTNWGASGAYSAYIILVPDSDVGFSVLSASSLTEKSFVTPILADESGACDILLHQQRNRRQLAFRTSPAREPTEGLFSGVFGVAFDWLTADSGTYGGLAVGLFVFDVDGEERRRRLGLLRGGSSLRERSDLLL
ncbi:MAG: hypothetical protein Q9173_005493 [Seirophora scorigena]